MIKKFYGQNFISDSNLIKKIINLLDDDLDLIIEIGPGRGALTKLLVKNFKNVIAIEIDQELEIYLSKIQSDYKFKIIYDDIMNIDFKIIINGYKKIGIISNTPYYLSSKILFNIFDLSEKYTNIHQAILMFQKEVALRICAEVNENNYNNLSIACKLYSERKKEFDVSKKMFYPQPKIDSSIVSFAFNQISNFPDLNKNEFIKFIRNIFNNKRKTILNNLGTFLNDKKSAINILKNLDISKNKRPEEIDLKSYVKIYKAIK